jgi:hypothetical protein
MDESWSEEGNLMDEEFDPLRILAGLRAHGVSYVLVGGLAEAAHGSAMDTDDVDICLLTHEDNLERLGLALQELDAQPLSDESTDEHRVSFSTSAGRLDCFEDPEEFPELHGRAGDLNLGRGIVARVASVEDLTRLKRASGDLAGATRLALGNDPQEQGGAHPRAQDQKPPGGRSDRIWRALENIDSFLTELNEGKVRRRRKT